MRITAFWYICRALLMSAFFTVLFAVFVIDMRTKKIPDKLILAAGSIGLLSVFVFREISIMERALGIVCVSFPLLLLVFLVPGSFGGGDIKLMAACGLFLGWKRSVIAFALAVLIAGGYCVWMLLMHKMERKSRFPFGPFLCVGMAAAICFRFSL